MNAPTAETIVACATGGWAVGGAQCSRALLRVSGPACITIERTLLSRPTAARSPLAARLKLTESLELPCLAWLAPGPRTFTGEDSLELLVPGNPRLVERVLARLCEIDGVRPAGSGEFSARAYLNGKLTLAQAEGIAAVIQASGADELAAAASVMRGEAGLVYTRWADDVATLLALVEAGIDFTDQDDVVAIQPDQLRSRIDQLCGALRSHLGAAAGREAPASRVRVAMVGPPNAGKSTLMNALLGRVRAIATPVAGTTRDVLIEPLTLSAPGHEAVEIDLLDLPGLDAHAAGVDAISQRAALAALTDAGVVLQCCEHGRFADLPAPAHHQHVVRVLTKSDRLTREIDCDVAVCALTGAGLDALRLAIIKAAGAAPLTGGGVAVPRHGRSLRAALASLAGIAVSDPVEVTAHHLRAALDALGEISGAILPDEVIGRVFSRFCIGK